MPDPAHRASDAEREATADRLRNAAVDGRLDDDELEERLAAAYRARTVGELEALGTDLPAAPVKAEVVPWHADEGLRHRLAGFITVNVVCIVVWAATGTDGSFWPVWPLLGTGIALFSSVVHKALGIEEHDHHHHHHAHHGHRPRHPPRPPELP